MEDGIRKELENRREKSIEKSSSSTEEVKLLTGGDSVDDKNALMSAGLGRHIKRSEREKGIEIDRKKYEEKYKGLVFTEEEIKEICIKYDLRFLRADLFRGKLDSEISNKLKDFIANNPEVGGYTGSFFIIATENSFERNYETGGRKSKYFSNIDPILVYRLPKEDSYVYIHKWGRNVTIWRRLRGIFFESKQSMITLTISAWIIAICAFFGATFTGFTGEWYQYLNIIWIVGVGVGLAYATLSFMFNEREYFKQRTTSFLWKTNRSRRDN